MKNILIIIACIPLIILLGFVAFAGYTAFVWVPLVLDHWVGLIIGTFISLATTVLVSKLPD